MRTILFVSGAHYSSCINAFSFYRRQNKLLFIEYIISVHTSHPIHIGHRHYRTIKLSIKRRHTQKCFFSGRTTKVLPPPYPIVVRPQKKTSTSIPVKINRFFARFFTIHTKTQNVPII